MKSHLRVVQVKSTIGKTVTMEKYLRGLGLRRTGASVTVANTPAFRGMVKKVLHLVTVEEVDAPAPKQKAAPKAAAKPRS